MSIRECIESPVRMGVDESLPWTICTSPWASSPLAASFVAKDISNAYLDVSASLLGSSGSSISSNDITTPTISGLTAGHSYRIEVKFTTTGKTWECFFVILAET